VKFGKRSVADAFNNALAELFISALERELLKQRERVDRDLRRHRVLLQPA